MTSLFFGKTEIKLVLNAVDFIRVHETSFLEVIVDDM